MRHVITAGVTSLLMLLMTAETVSAGYIISPDSIYRHIAVLANDSLEGRQVGEIGEWKASQYIKTVFESTGLVPKGEQGTYLQSFDFIKRIDFGRNNRLAINGIELKMNDEFEPMKQSASTRFTFSGVVDVDYGIKVPAEEGTYDDYVGKDVVGKAVVIRRFAPKSESNPHIDFEKHSSLTDKINTALEQKVAGILFITPEDQDDTLLAVGPAHLNPKDIPIIFLRRKGLERLGLGAARPQLLTADGETDLIKTRDTGYNVVGYLAGATDTTFVLGAHYDHLGWGAASSRYTGKEKMIHNGADDNASGVAALLELARYYVSRKDSLRHSLVFAAFSGEEEGLLGSSTFARNMPIDSSKVRMMVNLDMIGRLKDQDSGLAVFGTGTCEAFKKYFDSVTYPGLRMTSKEPGTGPSDQTAFYNRGIPDLYFFTGAHEDYHKPSDDVDKIDLDGTVRVAGIAADAVNYFDKYPGPLQFQKTKDPEAGKRRSQYSVTLGIMPDYIAEVKGLRIDGVSPERPAERAGLKEGDIIIKMGDIVVGDIYDYMNALGKFRKGDTTQVVVRRGSDTLSLKVIFE